MRRRTRKRRKYIRKTKKLNRKHHRRKKSNKQRNKKQKHRKKTNKQHNKKQKHHKKTNRKHNKKQHHRRTKHQRGGDDPPNKQQETLTPEQEQEKLTPEQEKLKKMYCIMFNPQIVLNEDKFAACALTGIYKRIIMGEGPIQKKTILLT